MRDEEVAEKLRQISSYGLWVEQYMANQSFLNQLPPSLEHIRGFALGHGAFWGFILRWSDGLIEWYVRSDEQWGAVQPGDRLYGLKGLETDASELDVNDFILRVMSNVDSESLVEHWLSDNHVVNLNVLFNSHRSKTLWLVVTTDEALRDSLYSWLYLGYGFEGVKADFVNRYH